MLCGSIRMLSRFSVRDGASNGRRWLPELVALGVLWLCGGIASLPLGTLRAAEPSARPNIILILADDLGYGDLGCFGQKRIKTPHLDRLAAEGLRFTDFYAGSTVCAPSRCVLMTGLHTGHCYIRGNSKLNLRPDDVTMAEVLRGAGYATGLFGKWGLGHEDSTGLPTRQGFDRFFGYLDQHHAHNFYPTFLIEQEKRFPLKNVVPKEDQYGSGIASERREYSHDVIVSRALEFVTQAHAKPFFLYLALTTPHANNEAGKLGMEVPEYGPYADLDWPEPQKGHAAMIWRMDRDIGRLVERLKQLQIDERTLIVFSSDNGPHREGGNDPDFNDSNGPLKGIKRSMHEGGIRVPTIARWPGKIAAGKTTNHIGYFADMMPTFAELAGANCPTTDGLSFVPTLLGETSRQAQHKFLYWEFYEGAGGRAVRQGKWKGVCTPFEAPLQLYDLSTDLGEETNLATKHPEIVANLEQALRTSHTPAAEWKVKPPMTKGKKAATP